MLYSGFLKLKAERLWRVTNVTLATGLAPWHDIDPEHMLKSFQLES